MAWIPRWTKAGINGTNAVFSMVSCAGKPRRTFHVCHSLRAATAQGRPTELRYTETHLDTIFALSTHPGKAGIAVIRISGPQAKSVCTSTLFKRIGRKRYQMEHPHGFSLIMIGYNVTTIGLDEHDTCKVTVSKTKTGCHQKVVMPSVK